MAELDTKQVVDDDLKKKYIQILSGYLDMDSSRNDGVNPLRPYYIPPSIGPVHSATPVSNGSATIPNQSSTRSNGPGLSSSAREFLTDLSYGDYVSDATPTGAEVVKGLLDQAVWKYTSILLAHPFEVSKTALQVYDAGATGKDHKSGKRVYGDDVFADVHDDSDSDPDEPAYFTSSKPTYPPRRPGRTSRHGSERSISVASSSQSPHTIILSSPSLLTVLSQLWQQSGAWGVWAGMNTSFIYGILLNSLESFSRSLLSALFNVSDPSILSQSANAGLDVVDAAYPWASLSIAVAASAIAAIITAPIDIVRTRLMLTPPSHPPRSLFSSLSALPSQLCPVSLILPTTLNAVLPTLLSASTPFFLRSKLGLFPTANASSYQVATFFSSVLELGIRLPLETVLRRGQLRYGFGLSGPGETIVPIGEYRGVLGTMWWIAQEEGESGGEVTVGGKVVAKSGQRRKGQGVEGLLRGWRVGLWGLVGIWGASALGGATSVKGGEF